MTTLRKYLPDLLVVAGVALIVAGLGQWSRAAALIFAGVALLIVGILAATQRAEGKR
jgi:hypothetical protein